MKFILAILSILCLIFLMGCSAKEGISKKELAELSNKYSGTYIFNRKFYEEIKNREGKRDKYMDDFFNKKSLFKKKDLQILNEQLPQTLSNGKQYYFRKNYDEKVKIPKDILDKIKKYIGEKAYKNSSMVIEEFYFDDNKQLKIISLDVIFYNKYTKYGLFGDEGRGFSLSRDDIEQLSGNNIIYMEDIEKGDINVK